MIYKVDAKLNHHKRIFYVLKIIRLWKKRCRLFGKYYERRETFNIQHKLLWKSIIRIDIYRERAIKKITDFIYKNLTIKMVKGAIMKSFK